MQGKHFLSRYLKYANGQREAAKFSQIHVIFLAKVDFTYHIPMKKRVNRCFFIVLCRIQWTNKHHTILLREILATETFKYKRRTQQRSNMWNSIVDHLNDRDCSPA